MPKRPYDPLACLPSAEVVRQRLTETERLEKRLRILLRVAEEVERTEQQDHVQPAEVSDAQ